MSHPHQRLFAVVALIGVALLSGCATLGPGYTPESAPPTDKATIYVYRDFNALGGAITYTVSVNGIPYAPLPTGGYFVVHAIPGELEFAATTEVRASVTVDAKLGQVYYVKGTVGAGLIQGHPQLVLVSNDVGQKEIASCKLVPESKPITSPTVAGLGEVSVPSDEGAITTFGDADWLAGVNGFDKMMAYVNATKAAIHGALLLTDRSLTLLVAAEAGSRTGSGLRIPYSDIASVEIQHFAVNHIVVVRRRDGHVDSFQLSTNFGAERKRTESAGALLRSKVQAQSLAPTH
jgi:hypothetical protein